MTVTRLSPDCPPTGFLLVTAGLANFAASGAGSRLQSAAAASGSIAILVLGALLARGKLALLLEPQTILLLAIGVLLTVLRLREIFRRAWRDSPVTVT